MVLKIRRKYNFWLLFIVLLVIVLFWQRVWVVYLYQQARGGLDVAFNTRPLEEVLKDKNVPDSLKKRILLIGEIKRFAIDSLGLQDNPKVYQTLYDQQGRPLVYLLTVAERYKMEAVMFNFPFIGNFTYKGFFDSTAAYQEENVWKLQGYDTEMGQGAAYSTLGWLPEPILSSMLYYSDGKLASLIIHEMTHGTIFVKDDHETSENLANFIGDYGAKRFLIYKYGKESPQFQKKNQSKEVRDKYIKHLNRGTLKLDSLYKTFEGKKISDIRKDSLKYALIEEIEISQDTILKKSTALPKPKIDRKDLPNNAYFIGFKTYNSKQNEFESIFQKQYKGNFEHFLKSMQKKYNQ
ncbi:MULTISPECIES: aminopeptidase [unclassified Arcicella]|uniref:aminopeptidase n=1 Tax=unclassified Arcicella TaxID=2644986 RepID=UPI0028557A59|nr:MULTISPECIES: aminopeptidase [unclassified Arcicella]MDR6564188.1 putative aminopeptidase [Arcicella sp. BE51]MDR6811566.1 putative aminopeptidase [Arcicella sp. BE140]MDR6823092.1 putative aminopeptidase [Arcicella sp. BE139]